MTATKTRKVSDYFVAKKRDNGESYVSLHVDRPEWLQDAVYTAHGGDMPNDWIYDECRATCDAIDDGSIDIEGREDAINDAIHDHADSRVEIYTKPLFQWAADMCLSDTFSEAESDLKDMGGDETTDMVKRLMALQYCAIRRIAETMVQAVKENSEADAAESAIEGRERSGRWPVILKADNSGHDTALCPCDECHTERNAES